MGQPLGVGCRKGCSSLALLPVLPWHVLGEQGVPQTPSPQCVNTVPHRAEPVDRSESVPCPHSIFPWIASLQGFALSPWCQGQGWECPVKSQLRNVPKLENRGVRMSPCQPWEPSLWVTPRVPWVKPSKVQSWHWCQQGLNRSL